MPQTVLITGTGRPQALGFHLVKRYLENGDRVIAGIRCPSEAPEALREAYPDTLQKEGNSRAPLIPYDHAETLRLLFEKKRHDKEGPVFVTYTGEEYPW